jgi:hypothetical protein
LADFEATESRELQYQEELQQADHPSAAKQSELNYVACFAVNSSKGTRCAAAGIGESF